MTQEELKKVLENHQHWLHEDCDGWENMRADLRGADLHDANLRDADLRDANLRDAYLRGADLRDANLRGAYLRGADLHDANLRDANLRGAYLRGAYLRDADLRGAYLRGADLHDAMGIPFVPMACPDYGSFIGWKKCRESEGNEEVIVKLCIPEDAMRSSATGRKCRASKAAVLEIQDIDGNVLNCDAYSEHDQNFVYRVGAIVVPKKDFCRDRWKECGSGIHFFINRHEAVEYDL